MKNLLAILLFILSLGYVHAQDDFFVPASQKGGEFGMVVNGTIYRLNVGNETLDVTGVDIRNGIANVTIHYETSSNGTLKRTFEIQLPKTSGEYVGLKLKCSSYLKGWDEEIRLDKVSSTVREDGVNRNKEIL